MVRLHYCPPNFLARISLLRKKRNISPEKARVAVFEDDPIWQEIIRQVLERAGGHAVVLTTASRSEALSMTSKRVELGVNVATIDGNLSPSGYRGEDGRAVLAAIHFLSLPVKTVGMLAFRVSGTDKDLGKPDVIKLGEIVTSL